MVIFFFASAGVSAAYLTVSEIFPLETRALCIAVFYAVGTGAGGVVGPLLFAKLIESGKTSHVMIGFLIGAVAMIVGGVAELFFGVKAERRSLESIAQPLTVEDPSGRAARPGRTPARRPLERGPSPATLQGLPAGRRAAKTGRPAARRSGRGRARGRAGVCDLVGPLRELLDDLRAEGGQVIGVAARHETLVDDDLLVDPVAAGVADVASEARATR